MTLLAGFGFAVSKQFITKKANDIIVSQIGEENIYKSEIEKKLKEVFVNNKNSQFSFERIFMNPNFSAKMTCSTKNMRSLKRDTTTLIPSYLVSASHFLDQRTFFKPINNFSINQINLICIIDNKIVFSHDGYS